MRHKLPRACNVCAAVDRWSLRRARFRPERNPKIIAILFCIAINLAPTALGIQPLPGSLDNAPSYLGTVATAFSALGCLMCVIGQLIPKLRDLGIAIELAGCVFLAAGMLFYAGSLWLYITPAQRSFAFGQSFGIGIGAILRVGQIALYVRGRRLAEKEHGKVDA